MVCEQERDNDGHIVFIGLGNGQVMEFRLSKDLNKFERKRTIMSKWQTEFEVNDVSNISSLQ